MCMCSRLRIEEKKKKDKNEMKGEKKIKSSRNQSCHPSLVIARPVVSTVSAFMQMAEG